MYKDKDAAAKAYLDSQLAEIKTQERK